MPSARLATRTARLPDGRSVDVEVRESSRARRLRLVAAPGRLPEVVAPVGVSARSIDRLVADGAVWLVRHAARAAAADRAAHALGPGAIRLADEVVPVERRTGARARAELRDGRLLLVAPEGEAGAALERWYRREARRRVEAAVALEAPAIGVRPGRISIRDARSRWGSCAASGALSFSWRLVLAPPAVLDYVVVHELCHLRVPNHSRRFWRLVAEHRPDWRAHARWLGAHGAVLLSYRPA